MNLATFNIDMQMIKFLNNEDLIDATVEITINEAFTMIVTVPVDRDLSDDTRFVAVSHPQYKGEYLVGQLARKQLNGDSVTYTFREYFYQQLDKGAISVEQPNFIDKPVANVLKYVLNKPEIKWHLEEVMNKNITIYLYYDSGLEVFSRVQEQLGGEYVFTCEIDPKSNALINHKVRFVESQGVLTGKRFERDTNVLTLEGDYDYNNIITKIYPRGKGVEVDNPEAPKNAPAGYGRRLTIKDVNPTKEEFIHDEDASKVWGSMYKNPRTEVVVYEDITDANILYQAGMRTLKERNHPSAVFSASVTDIDDLNLGDTVYIIWRNGDYRLEYATRVYKYTHDLVNPANSRIELGDKRNDGNMNKALSGMKRDIANAQNVATYAGQTVLGASAGYGTTLPTVENSKEGDTYYLNLKNGLSEMYVFLNGNWILKASSDAQEMASNGVLRPNGAKVYFGAETPTNPNQGDQWFKYDGDNARNSTLYLYKSGSWILWNGVKDANGLIDGSINGDEVNLFNLNASNINAGSLSANYIQGGTIDAGKINVINLNANSIASGTIDTANIKIVNKPTDTQITLSNGLFIQKASLNDGFDVSLTKGGLWMNNAGGVQNARLGTENYLGIQHNISATGTYIGNQKSAYARFTPSAISFHSNTFFEKPIYIPEATTGVAFAWVTGVAPGSMQKCAAVVNRTTTGKPISAIAFSDNGTNYAVDMKRGTSVKLTN